MIPAFINPGAGNGPAANEALTEVKDKAGSQFCPRCVAALDRILPLESVVGDLPAAVPQQQPAELVKAS